jgi:hypothetical protein
MAIIYAAGTLPGGDYVSTGASYRNPWVRAAKTNTGAVIDIPSNGDMSRVRQAAATVYFPSTTNSQYVTLMGFRIFGGGLVQSFVSNSWQDREATSFATNLRNQVVVRRTTDTFAELYVGGVKVCEGPCEPGLALGPSSSSGYLSELILSDSLDDNLLGSYVADVGWTEGDKTGEWIGGIEELQGTATANLLISGSPGGSATFNGSSVSGYPDARKFYAVASATSVSSGDANVSVNQGTAVSLPGAAVGELAAPDEIFTMTLAIGE